MKKPDTQQWARLEQVIRATNHTINSFALHIGLPRSENLYQIKRGNNGISIKVARRIHECYPEYSIGWLMCGDNHPMLSVGGDPVVRIPVFYNYTAAGFSFDQQPDDVLVLSTAVVCGAEVAVAYADDALNPYLYRALLLLKKRGEDEPILFGNSYLVMLQQVQLIRMVIRHPRNSAMVSLTALQPSKLGTIDIAPESVRGWWRVVGAVCNLMR